MTNKQQPDWETTSGKPHLGDKWETTSGQEMEDNCKTTGLGDNIWETSSARQLGDHIWERWKIPTQQADCETTPGKPHLGDNWETTSGRQVKARQQMEKPWRQLGDTI